MRSKTLFATMSSFINIGRAALIEGAPGLGKTQITKQAALAQGDDFGFILKHAPTMQPEDLGLPMPNATRSALTFMLPEDLPFVGNAAVPDRGLLIIDELPQGDLAIQKTCAHLIQEHELHGKKFKDGWTIMATGNRQQDRAGANRILSHLRNRVTTIEFEAHLDDWCEWAMENDVRPELISFLRFKPGMLHDFDPSRDINPTPRSWVEGVSDVIDKVPDEAEFECFKGAVGEGAAAEFVGFLKICRKLPNPDAILIDPTGSEVPTDPSTLYAISGAIAHRSTEANFERVMTYAKRLPQEFMVLVVRDAIKKDKKIQNTRPFIEWAMGPGAKVLM